MTTSPEQDTSINGRIPFAVAAVALEAGLAALAGAKDNGTPPLGWLPPPATGCPEIEFGVAFAIAALIELGDLPEADIDVLVESFKAQARGTEGSQ